MSNDHFRDAVRLLLFGIPIALAARQAAPSKAYLDIPSDVRLASKDVAVASVISRMSAFTSPDGVRHLNEQHIRTFLLVRQDARWLIMQDQNAVVLPVSQQ